MTKDTSIGRPLDFEAFLGKTRIYRWSQDQPAAFILAMIFSDGFGQFLTFIWPIVLPKLPTTFFFTINLPAIQVEKVFHPRS